MEGEEAKSDDKRSFSKVSILKRIAIVVAGATVNIIFAIITYFILMFNSGTYITNQVDSTLHGFAAEKIGLLKDDVIIQINDKKIKNQEDINKILNKTNGDKIKIKISRQDKIFDYEVEPTEVKNKNTGIYVGDGCKIIAIEKGSSAEKQGLKSNDKILRINNQDINNDINKIAEIIQNQDIEKISIDILRNKQEIHFELDSDYISKYYLGVNLKPADNTFVNHLVYANLETKNFLLSIVDNTKKLLTGGVSVDQMVGPVGISEAVAKTNGIKEFVYMMALISLSLGITNLLPIPALDGGKILILLIEAIRRKPLNEKLEMNIQLIGFSILIALSIYVTYNDILRII